LKRDTQALDMPKTPLQRGWLMGVFFFSPDTGNARGAGLRSSDVLDARIPVPMGMRSQNDAVLHARR